MQRTVDVQVVAFGGSSTQTLVALQDVFGIDAETAKRLLAAVPVVVRRQVPLAQAEQYMAALQGIGAEVVLTETTAELGVAARSMPPPVPRPTISRVPPPPPPAPPRAAPPSRAPAPPASTRTLSLLPHMTAAPRSSRPTRPSVSAPPSPPSYRRTLRKRGPSEDLELQTQQALEFDLGRAEPPSMAPAPRVVLASSEGASAALPAADVVLPRVTFSTGSAAAAVRVAPPGLSAARPARGSGALHFAALLFGVGVFAAGYWLDNTIVHGNATQPSVFAHALAIYMLGLGLRGVMG